MRIALVNCCVLPEPDIDEGPLLGALRGLGHDAVTAAWDDDSVGWGAFDAAVVRATWNYALHVDEYVAWVDRVSRETVLLNDAATIRRNLHKSYLLDLEAAGVPIIPSVFVEHGSVSDVATVAAERGWSKVVIKPSISAGSYATRVFDLSSESDAAQAFMGEMLAQRGMMVQRFMPSVAHGGETSMVHIDYEFSHAIQKQPRFADDEESVDRFDGVTDAMLELSRRVIDAADASDALYARVDLIEDDNGEPVLSELELIEPSLFFPYDEHAAARMAAAIVERVAVIQS